MGSLLGPLAACVLIALSGCKNHAPRDPAGSTATGYSDPTEAPAFPLSAAIARAQARVPKSSFVHAEVGSEDGVASFLVCFCSHEEIQWFELDAESGEILQHENTAVDAEFAARARTIVDSPAAPLEPEKAIARAVAAVPGSWARLLDLDAESAELDYVVEVVAGDVVKEVRLRAADGELVSVCDFEQQFEVIDYDG